MCFENPEYRGNSGSGQSRSILKRGSNDYQGKSRTDCGIVCPATITNEIAEANGNDLPHSKTMQ